MNLKIYSENCPISQQVYSNRNEWEEEKVSVAVASGECDKITAKKTARKVKTSSARRSASTLPDDYEVKSKPLFLAIEFSQLLQSERVRCAYPQLLCCKYAHVVGEAWVEVAKLQIDSPSNCLLVMAVKQVQMPYSAALLTIRQRS